MMRNFQTTQYLINGVWSSASSTAKTYDVFNPATGEKLATVPYCGRPEALSAIDAASAAFPLYAATTAQSRAKFLRSYGEALLKHKEELGAIITAECGKPTAEAVGEVVYSHDYVMWFAGEAERCYGDIIPSHRSDTRQMVLRQPVGVVGAVTPWNFPMAMLMRKFCASIAAGCTMVAKPAENTPMSAIAMCDLAMQCGLPKGVVNVVFGDYEGIGQELCKSRKVHKISFTGSTRAGHILQQQAIGKRVTMELGGNASLIVFEDANMELAIKGAMASKFRNTGQTCVCSNRFLVQRSVLKEFEAKLVEAMQKTIVVGDGAKAGVTMGPLINDAGVKKVRHLVDTAINESKARLVYTHPIPKDCPELGTFCAPQVLSDVPANSEIFQSEIFGPVVSITAFDTEEEALRLANDTPYGLASYFYSEDVRRAFRVSEKLNAGMIGCNDAMISSVAAPFGGVGLSGSGREGSKYGLDDYTNLKYVCMHI